MRKCLAGLGLAPAPWPWAGKGQQWGESPGAGSACWHTSLQPWLPMPKILGPCSTGMLWHCMCPPGDALGNLFLQAMRLQLGPSPVATCVAVFGGTPTCRPCGAAPAGAKQRGGPSQETAGTEAVRGAAGERKGRKACARPCSAPRWLTRTGLHQDSLAPSVPGPQNGAGVPAPTPLHPAGTHLTDTENSPGALSLSRIRKAPRYLRLRSSSSARCREILPAYHLQGAPGSAPPTPQVPRG